MSQYGDEDKKVDPFSFKGLVLSACFRPTMLTAFGAGTAVALVRAVTTRNVMAASSAFVYASGFTAVGALCGGEE